MSQSTIDAIVSRLDELRQAQGRDFAVVLHGGEPLLLGKALLARLLTGLRTRLPVGCTLSVQTNGTLLTDPLLDLFADAGATVSVSLDGPTKINDSRRMRFDQGGTFEATLGGIHCLQRHPVSERLFSGTLSVVEPSTDPSAVYWFLRGLGVPGMNFLLPDGNHSRLPPGKTGFDSHKAGEWLAGLFDVYMSDPDPVPIRVLDDLVKLLLGGSATKEGNGARLERDPHHRYRWDCHEERHAQECIRRRRSVSTSCGQSILILCRTSRGQPPFESMSRCSSRPPTSACVAPNSRFVAEGCRSTVGATNGASITLRSTAPITCF